MQLQDCTISINAFNVCAELDNVIAETGCQVYALVEQDGANCVCVNTPQVEVGLESMVIVTDGQYTFSIQETAFDLQGELVLEDVHNVNSFQAMLERIAERANYWMYGVKEVEID